MVNHHLLVILYFDLVSHIKKFCSNPLFLGLGTTASVQIKATLNTVTSHIQHQSYHAFHNI